MHRFGREFEACRERNARALSAFTSPPAVENEALAARCVREGNATKLFTIGYERRALADLIARLRGAGVQVLADVRQRAMSRRPEFRGARLRDACTDAGISYEQWPELGSTPEQRADLKETGDIQAFRRRFERYARRSLTPALDRLAAHAEQSCVALLCYETAHEDCHRGILADLIAQRVGATILAL